MNFMTKNGLLAQNTSTAAAAPEDMYTRREWDKHEILGNLAVGTQMKVAESEENTFMSTEHKAV